MDETASKLLTLGIDSTYPSVSEVRKAYRQLTLLYHPDASGSDDYEEFLRIKQVHDELVKLIGERKLVIIQNVERAYSLLSSLSEVEKLFIARFIITGGRSYYVRPIPFGYKLIDIESITTNEFNKLHRIAYQPWR